jgi:hypothetical protein
VEVLAMMAFAAVKGNTAKQVWLETCCVEALGTVSSDEWARQVQL